MHGMRDGSRVCSGDRFHPIAKDIPLRNPLETARPHAGYREIQALGQRSNGDTMLAHESAQVSATE
jgi:hypothetical protein